MAARDDSPWGGGGMDWASLPTKPRDNLPSSVLFNGREVALYTFPQLDRLGKKALKERAMNMRDLVGAQHLPRFSPGFQEEQIVAWLLEAQTIVASACGVAISVADLGAPKGGDGIGAFLTHLQSAPPSSLPSQQAPPSHWQQQQQEEEEEEPVFVLDTILDVRTSPQGIATHFLCKFQGHPVEAASWEPADQIQDVAPRQVAEFKQVLQQRQQSPYQRPPPQQYQPPPQAYQQPPRQPSRGGPSSPPSPYQQQPAQFFFRGGQPPSGQPPGSAQSPSSSSPLRPDQESDAVRDAARRRNQGSFTFG